MTSQDARHWTVYRCPSCGERIYLVSAGTFGCETWMVDVEPSESGYLLVTNDSFGALDRPVTAACDRCGTPIRTDEEVPLCPPCRTKLRRVLAEEVL